MKGDMSEPFLGLSEDDQQLLHETVHIVFHSAATVRFDEELRYNVSSMESGVQDYVTCLASPMLS